MGDGTLYSSDLMRAVVFGRSGSETSRVLRIIVEDVRFIVNTRTIGIRDMLRNCDPLNKRHERHQKWRERLDDRIMRRIDPGDEVANRQEQGWTFPTSERNLLAVSELDEKTSRTVFLQHRWIFLIFTQTMSTRAKWRSG